MQAVEQATWFIEQLEELDVLKVNYVEGPLDPRIGYVSR